MVSAGNDCEAGFFAPAAGLTYCQLCILGKYAIKFHDFGLHRLPRAHDHLRLWVDAREHVSVLGEDTQASHSGRIELSVPRVPGKHGVHEGQGYGELPQRTAALPTVNYGYMTRPSDPVQVFRCLPSVNCLCDATCAARVSAQSTGTQP